MYSSFEGAEAARTPKVLLVEDDTAVRRSLQLVLQARGFDVRAYADPEVILREGIADDVACLVADYRLPRETGIELLTALRARSWNGPAVLITAYPSAALSAEARRQGFEAILSKPFFDHEVADTVTRLVRSTRPHSF